MSEYVLGNNVRQTETAPATAALTPHDRGSPRIGVGGLFSKSINEDRMIMLICQVHKLLPNTFD